MKTAIFIAIIALILGFYGGHYVLATLLLIGALLIVMAEETLDPDDAGTCRVCGSAKVFRGYYGDTVCLHCERRTPRC